MVIKSIRSYNWKGKTVLIVEDDTASTHLLKEILGYTGIRILFAETGEKAINLCKKDKNIHIVLMDINLPEMDGYETTKRIKKFRRNLPVIAQTAYALSEDRERCVNTGCDGYVSKPINMFELLGKMDLLLNKEQG